MTIKSSLTFEKINKLDRDLTTRIDKFCHLFAPWNNMWHYFYPINPEALAKMAGIGNTII